MEGLHRRRWPSIVCCGVFLVAGMTAVRLHSQGPGSTEIILAGEPTGVTKDQLRQVSFDCKPLDLSADLARACRVARHLEGQRLFDEETFGGNGPDVRDVSLTGDRHIFSRRRTGATLEEVVDQYEFFFKDNPFGLIVVLTEQDKKDIVEYLKLL